MAEDTSITVTDAIGSRELTNKPKLLPGKSRLCKHSENREDVADEEEDEHCLDDDLETPDAIGSRELTNKPKLLPGKSRLCKQSKNGEDVADEEEDEHCLDDDLETPDVIGSRELTNKPKLLPGKSLCKHSGDAEDVNHGKEDDRYLDDDLKTPEFILSGPKGTTYRLCGKYADILFDHQKLGLEWLWSLHNEKKGGGILADDMGLGKTKQVCSFLKGLFQCQLIKLAMIVVTPVLLYVWMEELEALELDSITRKYHGKYKESNLLHITKTKGVILTTYDMVSLNQTALKGQEWDYMIMDEGHLIKNLKTNRTKSLVGIPCDHRVILTGTPIQNNLEEMHALFSICCPAKLGDAKGFKQNFGKSISRGCEKNASGFVQRKGSELAEELRKRIQPYFLRRLKDETLITISKKYELVVWLPLTTCQSVLYTSFLTSELYKSTLKKPLAAIEILKKICGHPRLLKTAPVEKGGTRRVEEILAKHLDEGDDNMSCKISFIHSILEYLLPRGHSVLIFSQTKMMLDLVQDSLISGDKNFLRLDGETKTTDREKIVQDFQNGKAPILLLTSKVGGMGLTLTKADRVIMVDPSWNPSTDSQCVDRAYRIGQKKDVIVYRLITSSTVEEHAYRKQVFKGSFIQAATSKKNQLCSLDEKDEAGVFNLPKRFDVSPTLKRLQEMPSDQIKPVESHIEFLESLKIVGVSHHSSH